MIADADDGSVYRTVGYMDVNLEAALLARAKKAEAQRDALLADRERLHCSIRRLVATVHDECEEFMNERLRLAVLEALEAYAVISISISQDEAVE